MASEGPQRLSAALLDPIRSGSYPDSEHVISAKLGPDELKGTIQLLRTSQEQLQAEIRRASSVSSSDVDSWIAQARQVQADIKRSKLDARDIVQKHEAKKAATAKVEDASAKVRFLHSETEYNQSVLAALQSIRGVANQTAIISSHIDTSHLKKATVQVQEVEDVLEAQISKSDGQRAWTLLASRASTLRARAHKELLSLFDELLRLEGGRNGLFKINDSVALQSAATRLGLSDVLEGLRTLGMLDEALSEFSKRLQRQFLQYSVSKDNQQSIQALGDDSLRLVASAARSFEDVINDIHTISSYLQKHLPAQEASLLTSKCIHFAVPVLVDDWLSASIPVDLRDMRQFQSRRKEAMDFADFLSNSGFKEAEVVRVWEERLPRAWLTRRRTAALDSVRKSFLSYRGGTKIVERVERGKMSKDEVTFANDTTGWDEWDATWTQEKESQNTEIKMTEDEDVSGWDFDGTDDSPESKEQDNVKESADTEENDAWGWGDDDEGNPTDDDVASSKPTKINTSSKSKPSSEKEIVLRENYSVTEIPELILKIVSQQLQTADDLNVDEFRWLQSASPSAGLRALPALIFAMFRATATSFYETAMSSGNIRLYNDCQYLAESLKSLGKGSLIPSLDDDINALDKFARTAYAREMDTQRTILGDLLDGAQGFSGCNEYPMSAECDTAIGSTVDRIEAVHNEWDGILSPSALLQSTGSLVATAIDKIIKDIEDMEDISEAESQRLAGYCNQMCKLDALFTPISSSAAAATEEPVPMTAVYVSNWLRFQYLANILESSLVDIKYLWTEGELSLEFSADEVIDLIKALFADSHHRSNAISGIRRHVPA